MIFNLSEKTSLNEHSFLPLVEVDFGLTFVTHSGLVVNCGEGDLTLGTDWLVAMGEGTPRSEALVSLEEVHALALPAKTIIA